MPAHENPFWHSLDARETARRWTVDPETGLNPAEVSERRAKFGPNEMTAKGGTPAWLKFLQQFHNALVYILLAATALAAFLGEWVDAAVIFGVVLVNAVVGYLQEAKAEKALGALSKLVRTEATVRRDGRKLRIPSAELVPGDIVLLQSGDRVPADLRLLLVRSLQCEEAALTGESLPVEKAPEPLPDDTVLGDRVNLAFAGTLVTYGQAEGIVVATGDHTEAGRIAQMLSETVDLSTPLTRKIAAFSRLLVGVILGLAAVTFLVGVLRGQPAAEMFMAAVALAVGAIPEGLPAAVTITLAVGVARMAKRQAIIRKLPAVETLGSTTVICSDKTGTLTENQMTVRSIFAGGEWFEVTGSGYEASGEIRAQPSRTGFQPVPDATCGSLAQTDSERPSDRQDACPASAALRETLLAGLLCNDTQLVREENRLKVQGDPTEAALIVAAQKAGHAHEETHRNTPRVDVIPFESEHMFMATLHEGSPRVIYKKGSVERLLERCDRRLLADGSEGPLEPDAIRQAVEQMAGEGLRVLAFARRHADEGQDTLTHDHVAGGLTFLGLQGMIDPPRAEAAQAVRDCREAGIAVKMITGDHAVTAAAIAAQLGLKGAADAAGRLRAITGRELEQVPDAELPALAEDVSVFARVAPEQKLRLVRALQSRDHVVAMTGDGVNDAPALKQADIGVAMGITGTDVAKGAAAMVLTDDNFATIEAAVEEGRNVFDNLVKFIVWTLPTNGGEAMILLTAIFLGSALPILPVHLLWINMTTAVLLGLTLVFEPKEPGLMRRPPRDPKQPLLTFPLLMRTGLVSLLMLCGAYALFLWEQRVHGVPLEEARTIVLNVIVMVEAFYVLNCRSLTHSFFSLPLFGNRWIWGGLGAMAAAQMLITYAPFMNRLFHTAPLRPEAWLHIAGVGLAVFLVVEFEKWARFGGQRGEHAIPE